MTRWWPDKCLGLSSSRTSAVTAFETLVLRSPESPPSQMLAGSEWVGPLRPAAFSVGVWVGRPGEEVPIPSGG